MHDEAAYWFAVNRLNDGKDVPWIWLCLPMGWSWSPVLCQMIGFGLLLIALENAGLNVSEYKKMTSPPPMVLINDV